MTDDMLFPTNDDDLLISAANADRLDSVALTDAGAVYTIYGTPRRIELPEDVDLVLANQTFEDRACVDARKGTAA